jgi:hypothetical protein
VQALGIIAEGSYPQVTPPSPPPTSSVRDRVGLCLYTIQRPAFTKQVFDDTIDATGAGVVRFDFPGWIHNSPQSWNWSIHDKSMGFCRDRNVRVLASASYCQPWMNGNHVTDKWPPLPNYVAEYASIAAEAEKRYGDLLCGIETWNEPWTDFWMPWMEPARFLELSIAQAHAVWAVNPNRDIVVMLDYWAQGPNTGKQWAQAVIAADTTGFLRHPRVVISTHNYCQSDPPQKDRGTGWSFDRWKLARSQTGNPRAWVTEYGWKAPGDCDEATEAKYIEDGLRMMLADGVERTFLFSAAEPAETWAYNLRRPDGTWKPAAAKMKLVASGAV